MYNIEAGQREPVGGAARLAALCAAERARAGSDRSLVAFGGDAFNPSLASVFTRGEHMVPVLNAIGVNVAVVGNHDLDFGVEALAQHMGNCTFPWLLANVVDKASGKPLAGAAPTHVLEKGGVKVGFVGLAEREWIATLALVPEDSVEYTDFVVAGRRLASELRREQGCHVVVALTHMRVPNDERLAAEAPEFDVVLGGHDHHYEVRKVEPHGVLMVKSGTEFRWVTRVSVELPAAGGAAATTSRPEVSFDTLEVTSSLPEDEGVAALVDQSKALLGEMMDQQLGVSLVELDGRFASVRTRETNLGNLVCDLLRVASGADMVLLNSGTLRSDELHPAGALMFRDLTNMLPMLDQTALIEMSGADVRLALENGVSAWPKLEGRFLQVSGVRFDYDATAEPGARVRDAFFTGAGGEDEQAPLDDFKFYRVLVKEYLVAGKDGFVVFKDKKILMDGEEAPIIPTTVRNHFAQLEALERMGATRTASSQASLGKRAANAWRGGGRLTQVGGSTLAAAAADGRLGVAPAVEGRIVNLAAEAA